MQNYWSGRLFIRWNLQLKVSFRFQLTFRWRKADKVAVRRIGSLL